MWEPMHEANADELKQHGTFDVSNLRSVRGELNKHWPSCHPKHDSEKFWEHEWSGYGTYTGMTQLQYFKKALSLLDQHAGQGLCGYGKKREVRVQREPYRSRLTKVSTRRWARPAKI